MRRTEFKPYVRRAIQRRANGACEECGGSVANGFEIDHIVSEGIAYRKRILTPADGRLLCLDCHKTKSAKDARLLAKAKRLSAKKPRVVGQSNIARMYGVVQEDPPEED